MKFPNFKEMKQGAKNVEDVIEYLSVALVDSLRSLRTGLDKLDLVENFESFRVDDLVLLGGGPGPEIRVRNKLRNVIPSGFFIVDAVGSNNIVRGSVTDWNSNFLFLENASGDDAKVSVIFFK